MCMLPTDVFGPLAILAMPKGAYELCDFSCGIFWVKSAIMKRAGLIVCQILQVSQETVS